MATSGHWYDQQLERVVAKYGHTLEWTTCDDDFCKARLHPVGDPEHCPMINGLKRVHPSVTYASAGDGWVEWTDRALGLRIKVRVSLRARDAQRKYDKTQEATPEDFGTMRMHLDEADISPMQHDPVKNQRQNERRHRIRTGEHVPIPQSEEYKAARRGKRRAA